MKKEDAIVATTHSALILYQTVSKTNTPLKIWSAVTTLDFLIRHPLPTSVMLHHLFGLATVGTILAKNIDNPIKYKFIYLESAFISAYLLKKNKYSSTWKLVHLIVHIFLRWPILLKGMSVSVELGYPAIEKMGYIMLLLDVYWLYKALSKQSKQNERMSERANERANERK